MTDSDTEAAVPAAIQSIVAAPATDAEVAFSQLEQINTDLAYHIAHASPGMDGNLVRAYHQRYLEVEQQLGTAITSAPDPVSTNATIAQLRAQLVERDEEIARLQRLAETPKS